MDDSLIKTVLVNDQEAICNAQSGHFEFQMPLSPGENIIRVRATDEFGNTSERLFIFTRERDAGEYIQGRYFALIIGIDEYTGAWPTLYNAVNDAQAVAEILRKQYQFDEIITIYNKEASRTTIIHKLEELSISLNESDNWLFV